VRIRPPPKVSEERHPIVDLEIEGSRRVSFGTDQGHQLGFSSDSDELYKRPHVAFAAPSREAVDRFHQAALKSGGKSVDVPERQAGVRPVLSLLFRS
jgi:hypothetical protein